MKPLSDPEKPSSRRAQPRAFRLLKLPHKWRGPSAAVRCCPLTAGKDRPRSAVLNDRADGQARIQFAADEYFVMSILGAGCFALVNGLTGQASSQGTDRRTMPDEGQVSGHMPQLRHFSGSI